MANLSRTVLLPLVGAVLVAHWSIGLIHHSLRVLLDWQADKETITALRAVIEQGTTDRVIDLHLWSIGHGIFSAQITVVSDQPKPPYHYKALLRTNLNVVHATVEVHQCDRQALTKPGRKEVGTDNLCATRRCFASG